MASKGTEPSDDSGRQQPGLRRRRIVATLLAGTIGVFLLVILGYFAVGVGHEASALPSSQASSPASPGVAPTGLAAIVARPHLVFQNVVRDAAYGRAAVVALDHPDGPRAATGLTCERLHVAAGIGLCLFPDPGQVNTYYAAIFRSDFQPEQRLPLGGAPMRARVSPDGRYGASSVFVFSSEENEETEGIYPTLTAILDMTTGATVGRLEQYLVLRDGAPVHLSDPAYWGATFRADSNRFFATVRSDGKTYLVEGDIAKSEVRLLRENVEDPSLSPDQTRIAFKKLIDENGPTWRLSVLDLATSVETPLAETRSVDDQAEWLDNGNVLYALGQDLWKVPSDGTGSPSLFLSQGLSPSVVP